MSDDIAKQLKALTLEFTSANANQVHEDVLRRLKMDAKDVFNTKTIDTPPYPTVVDNFQTVQNGLVSEWTIARRENAPVAYKIFSRHGIEAAAQEQGDKPSDLLSKRLKSTYDGLLQIAHTEGKEYTLSEYEAAARELRAIVEKIGKTNPQAAQQCIHVFSNDKWKGFPHAATEVKEILQTIKIAESVSEKPTSLEDLKPGRLFSKD
jgi:hypothetical protein